MKPLLTGLLTGLLAALLAGLIVAGCNSGKRSRQPIYGPGTDARLFPTFTSDPAPGATDADPDRDLVVSFAEGTTLADDTPGRVRLVDEFGRDIPGRASLAGPGTVVFDPTGSLVAGTAHRLLLTGLRTTDGLELQPNVLALDFTTRSAFTSTPNTGQLPTPGSLLINEIFPGTADTNGIPSSAPLDDQFVEIVNVSNRELNLRGVVLSTNANSRAHVFQPLLLPPGGAVTVFARAPIGRNGAVQASSTEGLRLNTPTGDRVRLLATAVDGTVFPIDDVTFPRGADVAAPRFFDESIVRAVDARVGDQPGGSFVPHPLAAGALASFSPGTTVNGVPFLFPTFPTDTGGPTPGTDPLLPPFPPNPGGPIDLAVEDGE